MQAQLGDGWAPGPSGSVIKVKPKRVVVSRPSLEVDRGGRASGPGPGLRPVVTLRRTMVLKRAGMESTFTIGKSLFTSVHLGALR